MRFPTVLIALYNFHNTHTPHNYKRRFYLNGVKTYIVNCTLYADLRVIDPGQSRLVIK